MDIAIIGKGVVGKATAIGLRDEVSIRWHDPELGCSTDYEMADVVFVCVPTNLNDITEELDTSILSFYLEKLRHHRFVYVRSTIPYTLCQQYPNIAVVPEYLREWCWQSDAENPAINLCGGNTDQLKRLEMITNRTYYMTTPQNAALSKMATNSFLATKVHFYNILYTYCQQHNLPFSQIRDCMELDDRLGYSHSTVPGADGRRGFGGKCLPKDLTAFATLTGNDILKQIIDENEKNRQ